MILAYNLLSALLLLFFLPGVALIILLQKKYRGRTLERLGLQTEKLRSCSSAKHSNKVIWIHALSVGEVTSALPLVKALAEELAPQIVVSVATRSGKKVASRLLSPYISTLFYSPFDVWFAVKQYLDAIQPDLFILVETDFWPNWLYQLKRSKTPVLLVNGRISAKSFSIYSLFSWLFRPMFDCFSLFSMQTAADGQKMAQLGITPEKIITLGNLKYDMDIEHPQKILDRQNLHIPSLSDIFICGSTHKGEEAILFAAFANLAQQHDLFLIIAPRNVSRGQELVNMAKAYGMNARTRTSATSGGNVLILDTIGELASCYHLAKLAFIGGSLVPQGGHNPIEAATFGVPVLFGPHMEDFAEIAEDLVRCKGAKTVTEQTLTKEALAILTCPETHQNMAEQAQNLVRQHQGNMSRHIKVISQLLV
jgi:3-deoxy-D-manno-octulosonic-acid transferase